MRPRSKLYSFCGPIRALESRYVLLCWFHMQRYTVVSSLCRPYSINPPSRHGLRPKVSTISHPMTSGTCTRVYNISSPTWTDAAFRLCFVSCCLSLRWFLVASLLQDDKKAAKHGDKDGDKDKDDRDKDGSPHMNGGGSRSRRDSDAQSRSASPR